MERQVVEPPEAFAFWQVHDVYAPAVDADLTAQHLTESAARLQAETGDMPTVAVLDAPHLHVLPSEKQWPAAPEDDDVDPEVELDDELDDPEAPEDDDPEAPEDDDPSPDPHAINAKPKTPASSNR